MKQYQSLRGQNYLDFITEWSLWGLGEFFQAFLGALWIGVLFAYIMFAYNYWYYYDQGVNKKDKSYYLTYLDFRKIIRRIVVSFIIFMIGSYGASFVPGFYTTVVKGCALGAIIWPPIYKHFSNEDKYFFQYHKND